MNKTSDQQQPHSMFQASPRSMSTESIILDVESTWPLPLRQILDAHTQLLIDFEKRRTKIDQQCQENVVLRANPPENPYKWPRSEVANAIEDLLQSVNLVGYHCTRLHKQEINDIINNGLVPLSPQLVESRIQRCHEAGDLSEEIARYLVQNHWADDQRRQGRRTGMLWFLFTKSLLKSDDGLGISSFFRSWGGEALYAPHEENPTICSILQQIGTPCIIEAVVPAHDITLNDSVIEIIIGGFLHRRGNGWAHDAEGYVYKQIERERILRVIQKSDPEFERLTLHSSWSLPLN